MHNEHGHMSEKYVLNRLSSYWWPGMTSDVKRAIKECLKCMKNKPKEGMEKEIYPLPIFKPFFTGHLDLLGKLPGEYKFLFVYTDHTTKYTIAIPMKNKDASTVADVLIKHVFYKLGFIPLIISDQGSEFLNQVMSEIGYKIGSTCRFVSVGHSISNGMVERKNKVLMQMLKIYVSKYHEDWPEYVDKVCFIINTYHPRGLFNSAFELLHGMSPYVLSDWDDDLTLVNHKSKENHQRLIDLQEIRNKSALLEYRVRILNRRLVVNPKYNIGDYLLAKKKKKDPGSSRKINPEQSGPYEILEVNLGSAVLRIVKSRKIIDGIPTYLLTKFTPQSINQEKERERESEKIKRNCSNLDRKFIHLIWFSVIIF